MKMTLAMAILMAMVLVFGLSLGPAAAASFESGPGMVASVALAEDNEGVEGATPADRSPLEDLNPAESSWQVWIGPVMIGVFALVLALLIRRFSMGSRNGSRGGDDDQSSSK